MLTFDFLLRLIINLATIIILIRYIYLPTYKKWDNLFPFALLNFLVFLLSSIIFKTNVFASTMAGFGSLGLLAAFTLLRFRTRTISLKDMTYLFVVLTLGVINAIMSTSKGEIAGLNALILIAVYVADGNKLIKNQQSKLIKFDDITNIKPQDHDKLIEQLIALTGLNIQKIDIESINSRKNIVVVRIYYL